MTTTNDQALTRDEALRILRDHKAELAERFGVDILVTMDIAGDWKRSFDLQFFLEDLLDHPVDLVVNGSLRRAFRTQVLAEAVDV